MTRSEVLEVCSAITGAVEEFPFGEGVAVFKVGGRMFALVSLDGEPGSIHLKCDPDLAEVLRERYGSVGPGYHLNKRHWNTVELDGTVPADDLRWMIEHSYERVVRPAPVEARRARGRKSGVIPPPRLELTPRRRTPPGRSRPVRCSRWW